MELRDLIVTPILLILIYTGAYFLRPYLTDSINRRYFFPALTVRIFGALAVGFVYQFYYTDPGDTFGYHTYGSRVIWETFVDTPEAGIKLLFSNGEYGLGLWSASSKIWYWRDPTAFIVIRICFLFDLITFSSYSGTAVMFAVVAFFAAWMLFTTFSMIKPTRIKAIALATLFVPSVIFWGSGIFKDTITLAAVSFATAAFYRIFIHREYGVRWWLLLIISCMLIYKIKVYILLCLAPALLLWWFGHHLSSFRSPVLRALVTPLIAGVCILCIYLAVSTITADDPRYNIDRIAETARITAYDIRYGWGARFGEGSGYTLGELDGSWSSMVALAPAAINVSLFRPYLWEVRNPLMLMSAMEALLCVGVFLFILIKVKWRMGSYMRKPEVLFCIVFAITFAFGVGISTFNFGTLSRYKIPMMPYFFIAMVFIYDYWKSDKKLPVLAITE